MKQFVFDFLRDLSTERGLSRNTRDAYANDLHQFRAFVAERLGSDDSGAWGRVDIDLLNSYIDELREGRGLRETTVARKVAAIRAFYEYLSVNRLITADPTLLLPSPRVERTLPQCVAPRDVRRLLAAAADTGTPEGSRDACVLTMLCYTGLQVSEMVALDVADVDVAEGSLRVPGKGGRQRLVGLHPDARKGLRDYIAGDRNALLGDRTGEEALFLNKRGARLTRQWVWSILKTATEAAGLGPGITPRSLRHSCAAHLLDKGATMRQVQEFLGHSSISTTQAMYTGQSAAAEERRSA